MNELERTERASGEVRDPRQEHPVDQDLETQDRQTSALPAAADQLADDLESGVRALDTTSPGLDLAGSQQMPAINALDAKTRRKTRRDRMREPSETKSLATGPGPVATSVIDQENVSWSAPTGASASLGSFRSIRVLHEDEADHEDDQQDGERERPARATRRIRQQRRAAVSEADVRTTADPRDHRRARSMRSRRRARSHEGNERLRVGAGARGPTCVSSPPPVEPPPGGTG